MAYDNLSLLRLASDERSGVAYPECGSFSQPMACENLNLLRATFEGSDLDVFNDSPSNIKVDPVVAEHVERLSLDVAEVTKFRTYTMDPVVAESREGFGLDVRSNSESPK